MEEKNELEVMSAGAGAIDSSSVLVFDDYLDFDPFGCSSIEDAATHYLSMVGSLNRHALYFAYAVGRLINKDKLYSKFGVKNLKQVADLMHVSKMTLLRYRCVYELLTPNQVKQLASKMVSVNAVLAVAHIKLEYPDKAQEYLDGLMSGELHTSADVEDALVKMIEDRNRPANFFPGGTSNDDTDAEEWDNQNLLCIEGDKTAEERIAELNGDVLVEDFGPDKSKEAKRSDKPKSSLKHETIDMDDDEGEEDTQNKRDIKALMRASRAGIAALRRDLVAVRENVPAQMDTLHERSAVIMGDQEMFEEFNDSLTGIYEDIRSALAVLIPEFKRGMDYGLITGKCVLPDTACLDELFRKEE